MKPLARWTIGYCNELGEECLRLSVRRFRFLYPEFDRVICYNNLKPEQVDRLKKLGEDLYEQTDADSCVKLTPYDARPGWKFSMPGWGWKLAPPRLRSDAHELWIDNDIVFHERIPTIDDWLTKRIPVISSAHRAEYGSYSLDIPHCCAGLFGLPPGLDFQSRIEFYARNLETLGYYDEQGVVCSVVTETDYLLIPMDEVLMVKNMSLPYAAGMHFIGLNRTEAHPHWSFYKRTLLKC